MLLTYHEIVTSRAEYVYSATSAELAEHLKAIQMREFRGLNQLVTFDDGHLSQYTRGIPVLEQQAVKAIFFVTAGWTSRRRGYMNWGQLRELLALGHQVQSHGWSHEMLTRCSSERLREELRRSKYLLEDKLGVAVHAISMPGGRWNKAVLSHCEQVGYTKIYTSDAYARPTSCGNLTLLGRYMIRRGMSRSDVIRLLDSVDAKFSCDKALFHVKRSARAILGDAVYHRLWRWIGRSGRANSNSGHRVESYR